MAAFKDEPGHQYAKLYLAHLYFDMGRFQSALGLFKEFVGGQFAASGQGWRDVKIAELILSCAIELRDKELVPVALRELLDSATRLGSEEIPIPRELTTVLLKYLER